MNSVLTTIGMMSGTSLDGIDIALIKTDGMRILEIGPGEFIPYTPEDRVLLKAGLNDARGLSDRFARPGKLREAEIRVTERHVDALKGFLDRHAIPAASVAGVGFHGQTVFHDPLRALTVQIGDSAALASATGVPVIADLRQADMAAGGQGAPLAPLYHDALATRSELKRPLAVVNIGGVSNISWLDEKITAFDSGPGNALLDDWIIRHDAGECDRDGRITVSGTIDAGIVQRLLDNPYFERTPPKSLDRDEFDASVIDGLSLEDGAATLLGFTIASIAKGLSLFDGEPEAVIIVGGGRHNPNLMRTLSAELGVNVQPAEAVGWRGDLIEAEAFAYLAARSLKNLSVTVPGTTGVAEPLTGGVLISP